MTDFDEVKINVRSLLTISKESLSIRQLQKDYFEQEGENLPYKSLGYNSVIELLQDMKDVLVVPPNPDQSSLLSVIADYRTSHIRSLVIKQKSNTKKKKKKSNKTPGNYKNKKFHDYNYKYYAQNIGNDSQKYNTPSPIIKNHRSQLSSSNYKEHSNLNINYVKQNGINNQPGYVTNELQSYIENYISENQMSINENKLKELVKQHPDYSALKVNCMQDLKNRMNSFLNISETGITLKNGHKFETNETEGIFSNYNFKDTTNSLIKKIDVITSQPTSHIINSPNKTMNDYEQFSDKQVVFHMLENLQTDVDQNNETYISSNNTNEVTSKTQKTETNVSEYVEFYKNKNCIGELKNVYVKKQEIRQTSNINKTHSNGNEPGCILSNLIDDLKVSNNIEKSFLISKQNNHDTIEDAKILNKFQTIPKDVLLNITYIFKSYHDGLNIANFKLIYNNIFHTFFDPIDFGFTSIKQLYKFLTQTFEIRDSMFYTKEMSLFNVNILKTQEKIIQKFLLSYNLKIALHIDQLLVPQDNNSNSNMLLVEVHNPASFYLQYEENTMELKNLMNKMQDFYDIENKNYFIQPEHILPGFHYASSFTSYFSNVKQWLRTRILREIDSLTVEIFYVDYGVIDIIPKTELRFLKNEFCHLPCQAIHCCLTDFNELDSISPEVTDAFWEIVDDKPVQIQIDQRIIFNDQCQILHVTLYQSNNLSKLKNINEILTILHENH